MVGLKEHLMASGDPQALVDIDPAHPAYQAMWDECYIVALAIQSNKQFTNKEI